MRYEAKLTGRAAALPVNAAKAILAYYFALCLIGHAAAGGSGPPIYFTRTTTPLQQCDFQRSAEGKITFETFSTTSNVVFLMSYVSNTACGTVF